MQEQAQGKKRMFLAQVSMVHISFAACRRMQVSHFAGCGQMRALPPAGCRQMQRKILPEAREKSVTHTMHVSKEMKICLGNMIAVCTLAPLCL